MLGEQTHEGRRENLTQANKLSRTYTLLLEALDRHRGKSREQKVTVKHVHVHSGGQAIVGTVDGGGVTGKSEDQGHAIAHAPQPALRSPDPHGGPVPVPCDAERALPDARRQVPRRAEGE
jgi:hypothetical protein